MEMRKINKIILHCSDSNNRRYDFDLIRKDHKAKGWSDIGYHFGVDFDGNIHFLRKVDRVGAHAKGANKDSIGVCVLGKDPDKFTAEQMKSLATLVGSLMIIFGVTAHDVYGHFELNEFKTCPNFDVAKFIEGPLEDFLCL